MVLISGSCGKRAASAFIAAVKAASRGARSLVGASE
jgi:hypothetical protein